MFGQSGGSDLSPHNMSGKAMRLVVATLIFTNVVSMAALVWLMMQNQGLRQQFAMAPSSQVSPVPSSTPAPVAAAPGLVPDGRAYLAAQRGQLEQLKAALNERPDLLNARAYPSLSTPLHAAVYYRREEIVQELLARKADVHATNRGGLTPLHDCVDRGTTEIAVMLLEHGASLSARTIQGLTPMEYALAKNRPDMAAFLRERGARE
jgi:hypothetical protein